MSEYNSLFLYSITKGLEFLEFSEALELDCRTQRLGIMNVFQMFFIFEDFDVDVL
jgi:hypothetical protein